MRRVAAYLVALAALCWPLLPAAQPEDDKGYITRTLEDLLSEGGYQVEIFGFRGALSSRAEMDLMTISDEDGAWLTLKNVTLDWTRSALLQGRVLVNALIVEEIELPRRPQPVEGAGTPAPEASGFTLPELPVSVEIGEISAGRVSIGEPVFGVEASITAMGSMSLIGSEALADLAITRLDGPEGALTLKADYKGIEGTLALDVSLQEAADGIIAGLLDLPGRPSIDLTLAGTGPLDDYRADLALRTDGQDRLTGGFTLAAVAASGDRPGGRRFTFDVTGDITPLVEERFRPFFGEDAQLTATGLRGRDESLTLDALSIEAATLTLNARAALDPDGFPESFAIQAVMADPAGGPVLLPVTGEGPETRVRRAVMLLDHDAAKGPGWTGSFVARDVERADLTLARLRLEAEGELERNGAGGGLSRSVEAQLRLLAEGLAMTDPALAQALGDRADAAATLTWIEGTPLSLSGVELKGPHYALTLDGTVADPAEGLRAEGTARAEITDLSAASGLAGRPMAGRAVLDIEGEATLLAGFFDLTLSGTTEGLAAGHAMIDRLLGGAGAVTGRVVRNEGGISLSDGTLKTEGLQAAASGALRSDESTLTLAVNMPELARVSPEFDGPASFDATLTRKGNLYALELDADPVQVRPATRTRRPGGGVLSLSGSALVPPRGIPRSLSLQAVIADITGAPVRLPLSGEPAHVRRAVILAEHNSDEGPEWTATVALRDIQARGNTLGRLRLEAEGVIEREDDPRALPATVTALFDLVADGLQAADPALERAVGRAMTAGGGLAWRKDGTLTLTGLRFGGPHYAATLNGQVEDLRGEPVASGSGTARLDDIAAFAGLLQRPISGAAELQFEGTARRDLSTVEIDLTAETRDLGLGWRTLDGLFGGDGTLRLDAARDGERLTLRQVRLSTPGLTVRAEGALGEDGGGIDLSAQLANLTRLTPLLSGPLGIDGTIRRPDERFALDLDASGPAGSTARISGTIAGDGSETDLTAAGRLPLGLADTMLSGAETRLRGALDFDLAMRGAPGLSSLSGTILAAGAQVLIPAQRLTLQALDARAEVTGGTARLAAQSDVAGGGRATLDGTIQIAPGRGFPAALSLAIRDLARSERGLYDTTLNGALQIDGPLEGGANITGTVELGPTELRIPSSTLAGAAEIPRIIHLNEPARVHATRKRAGLIARDQRRAEGRGTIYGLDIRVSAPNRIFLRGRGLDAELGGSMRLGGTTRDVIPSGRFELIRGRLDFLGRRLVLTEGSALLAGQLVPVIRVLARGEARDGTEVFVIVDGPAVEPEISFRSDPDLPEDEILARLIFGRGVTQLSAVQAAQLAAAIAQLSGRGGGGVLARLRESTARR